jgi:hypothetical protein
MYVYMYACVSEYGYVWMCKLFEYMCICEFACNFVRMMSRSSAISSHVCNKGL